MRTIILDSGAFSAWSRGEVLNLDDYIAFIFANCEYFDHYVNLDFIPGSFGVIPSLAEVEASAQKSWDNFLYMESHGLKPMPVFHMGESFGWLHKMIQHGCDYIGISPANDRPTAQKRLWLDRVFTEIGDSSGRPVVKTHGLGVTAIPLLTRYPWYSVDSSSWTTASARGVIYVPRLHDGKCFYDNSPLVIYMSAVKDPQTEERDYRTLSALLRKHVDSYIEEAGTTLELAKTDCKERARIIAYFFLQFEKLGTHTDRFIPHRSAFFSNL
jgi:hypothetical protein